MATVKPIPDGCHTIIPHLICQGAGEALDFYKKAFGAEEVCRCLGPDGKGVMHAEMKIGDSLVYLADEFPAWGVMGPKSIGGTPVTVHIWCEDVDKSFAKATAAGATAMMPPADMFWGDRYGKLVDPFGHHWSMGTHIEDVSPEEMSERMAKSMGGCGQ